MARVSFETGLRVVITGVVGAIGAAAGFEHTHAAAYAAGQHGWLAWADAVVIESMAGIAGLELMSRPARGRDRVMPGVVLVVSVVVQMAAQVSQAPRSVGGWLYAALPAAACLTIIKFALSGDHHSDQPERRDVVAARSARSEDIPVTAEPVAALTAATPAPAQPSWGQWPQREAR